MGRRRGGAVPAPPAGAGPGASPPSPAEPDRAAPGAPGTVWPGQRPAGRRQRAGRPRGSSEAAGQARAGLPQPGWEEERPRGAGSFMQRAFIGVCSTAQGCKGNGRAAPCRSGVCSLIGNTRHNVYPRSSQKMIPTCDISKRMEEVGGIFFHKKGFVFV